MTQLQEMMLAVCFGSVVGAFIGNLIAFTAFAISGRKGKHRKRKTEAEDADNTK